MSLVAVQSEQMGTLGKGGFVLAILGTTLLTAVALAAFVAAAGLTSMPIREVFRHVPALRVVVLSAHWIPPRADLSEHRYSAGRDLAAQGGPPGKCRGCGSVTGCHRTDLPDAGCDDPRRGVDVAGSRDLGRWSSNSGAGRTRDVWPGIADTPFRIPPCPGSCRPGAAFSGSDLAASQAIDRRARSTRGSNADQEVCMAAA
jgi:hypothetical protein